MADYVHTEHASDNYIPIPMTPQIEMVVLFDPVLSNVYIAAGPNG